MFGGLWAAGEGGGGRVSLHPQNLQGLLPRQNLSTLQASRRFPPVILWVTRPGSGPAWPGSIQWREGEKGRGGDPASSFLLAEWQAAGWTHAWQMAFQRVFRSHLGWVQLLQATLLTKPEGLLPGRREVKQILSCSSGTAYYKKK